MISFLCGLHVKHTGHPGGLFPFPVDRRHQFSLAKDIKSIDRGNTAIAKSPWPRAMLSMRILLLKHQKLPSPEQCTIPDMTESNCQVLPTALDGREPTQLQPLAECP